MNMGAIPYKILEDIQLTRLPSPPAFLVQLLEACNNLQISFDRLAQLIGQDPALSARVIAVANSAAFDRGHKTGTIKSVLITLGLDTVKGIAVTASVQQYFIRFNALPEAELARLWAHALGCACTARALAGLVQYPSPDEAFIAGLLHDIGLLALAANRPQAYLALRAEAADEGDGLEDELEQFGVRHDELGGWLLDHWQFPPMLADAVRYHHAAPEGVAEAHALIGIVQLADQLSRRRSEAISLADRLFGLTAGVAADLIEQGQREMNATAQAMGISLPAGHADETAATTQDAGDAAALQQSVAEIALLDGVREQIARCHDDSEATQAVLIAAQLLFDIRYGLIFRFDTTNRRLRGQACNREAVPCTQLALDTDRGQSLAVQALLTRQPLTTRLQDEDTSVADRQLAGLLKADEVLYLPLLVGAEPVGLLALGIHRWQGPRLHQQQRVLTLFAAEAAQKLHGLWQAGPRPDAMQALSDEFHLKARQTVHEANNPLSIMRNYLHLLGDKLGDEHPAQPDLGIIREELDRVGGILRRLTDRDQAQAEAPAAVDVNALIQDLLGMMQGSLLVSRRIETRLDLDPQLPPVVSQRNTLKQILINLMKNAIEAMGAEGTLSVCSQDYVYLDDRAFIEIVISDNGPGIPPHILAQLFQPVQSTKGGEHSGLGLSIVNNLIKTLHGRISCRSNETSGTRFQLLLPRELGT